MRSNMIDIKNKDEILNAIIDLLEKEFELPREKLTPDAKMFEDLDLDSIDAVDLIVKLQKMTGTKVQPEEFKQIRTLSDIADVIHNILNRK